VTATSAARDARNRDELFARIERAVGAIPELLSGDAEAALSFAGATADRNRAEGPFVTLDIGGGSTELALGRETATHGVSLDVGCVRLSERFLATDDPPTREQLHRARNHVRSLLANAEAQVPARSAPTWLGLAGTVTSLAALDAGLTHYDPTRTHGYRLTRARVEALHDELCALPVEARAARLLEPQRAGVILGGTLVLVEILSYFERAEIVVSERDILDGLAASLR
jgi:exopolyphosphatase/guanosine-5'-triphosphate,3'-diphosphate pyrophosphatase